MHILKLQLTQRFFGRGRKQINVEICTLDGKKHNENGPAYREWYKNGKIKVELFYFHGQYHNGKGIASRNWDENGVLFNEQYFLNGINRTKEQFDKETYK